MAYADTLKVFGILRKKFDEASAEAIATAVETALETNNASFFSEMVTKGELAKQLAETKAEIIKWMFIFWIGQFASIVGVITAILFAFFKK